MTAPGPRRRGLHVAVLGAAALGVLVSGLPLCPLAYATGYPCPACGLTRASLAVFHGQLAEAIRLQPLVFLATPLFGAFLFAVAKSYVTSGSTALSLRQSRWFGRLFGLLYVLLLGLWAARSMGAFGGPVAVGVAKPTPPAPPQAPPSLGPPVPTPAPQGTETAPPPKPAEPEACRPPPPVMPTQPLPFDDDALRARFRDAPGELGPAVFGGPTRGRLFGAAPLLAQTGLRRAGGYPHAAPVVVASLVRAVRQVQACHPESPDLYVGDLSRRFGGYLKPHRSHQQGLDADVGYYYLQPAGWYQRATPKTLDVARTWTLIATLADAGNVEDIFVDRSLHATLREHGLLLGHSGAERWFPTPQKRDTLITHTWGHASHLHVRFRDPEASRLGDRLSRVLPETEIALRLR